MKRKRSRASRQPRPNTDTLFQSYFGQMSLVEPIGKQAENEKVKDTMVASTGLGTGNKPKKLKLKFGGVTHTIHANSKTETGISSDSLITKFSPCSDGPKPQDDTDGNYGCPFDKRRGLGDKWLKPSITESGFTAENHSHRGKTTGETTNVNHQHVCKSKRITRRCALNVDFSDEYNEDAELHFLKGPGIPGSIKDDKMKLNSWKKYEGWDYVKEDPTSSDESISERKRPKKESVDLLVRGKECTYLNHNCSVGSFKDVLSGSDASIVDISDGLVPRVSRRKRGELSEMEQQLKKAEAAQKRKIQSEKAAREAEAVAIRKILGQESGRKKRGWKMNNRRDEFVKEKSNKSFNLGSNTVRLTMSSQGTVVTFSEDIGLPSIFQMGPNSYPPPREKCAGPNCTNEYKYRDSKSKLPLCSLGCYRVLHEKIRPVVAC